MAHAHHTAFQTYECLLILVLSAGVYVRGWLHVRTTDRGLIPARRVLCFAGGLFLIWFAVASPMASFVHELLTAHMIQHLLLMTIAAPLIWLGEPAMAFAYALPEGVRERMRPLFRRPSMRRAGKAITHPAVCWLAASGALVGFHIPAVLAIAMESPARHAIVEASFLLAGLLFWQPIVQPWPSKKQNDWLTVMYLFLATLPCDILSGFLVFCDRVVYAGYVFSSHPFGLSPLDDQQFAGALMWTVVTVVYFIVGGVISARLLSPQRAQEVFVPHAGSAAPLTGKQSMEAI
jgi:putative membrane protein